MTDSPLRIHVQEPWFSEIAAGRKSVEGKIGPLSKFQHLVGSRVAFHCEGRQVLATIVAVRHYDSLDEYLASEGWASTAPHTGSLPAANEAYLAVRRDDGVRVFAPDRVRGSGGLNALALRL